MSDKHSHSEDQSMEHLFRTAFDGDKEPIEEQEADAFLDQLEEKGFFKENKKKPLYLFLLIGLFFITVTVMLYSYLSKRTVAPETLPESKALPAVLSDSLSDTAPAVEKQNKEIQAIETKTNQSSIVPVNHEKEFQTIPLEEVQKPRIDSMVQVLSKPELKSKDSVRVKYVMQVDTIKTVDSLTINKRKWNRMKEKNK